MPATPLVLTFESTLAGTPAALWAEAGTMAGVNRELGPLLRMTVPRHLAGFRLDDAPLGQPLFASWVLLLFLPIDRHFFLLERVDAPHGFRERSSSWTERVWIHERSLTAAGEGACLVRDRLEFTPRIGLLRPLLNATIGAVFRHRHRRLRARFGLA